MEVNYQKKYVAFLDVMGFKRLVDSKQEEDRQLLQTYFNKVAEIFDVIETTRSKENLQKLAISDCVILVADEDYFKDLLVAIRTFQSRLALENIWIRGAVTFGEVCFRPEENLLVGPAYTRAYLLEETQAEYARVIIDPKILKKLDTNREDFCKKCNVPASVHKFRPLVHDYNTSPRTTKDDAIFVSYATDIIARWDLESGPKEEHFETNMGSVYKHIRKNLYSSQEHFKKYLWLKEYFAESIEEYNRMFPEGPLRKQLKKLWVAFKAL